MFETRYIYEYGEPWVFRNEPETAAGTVEESDVDGETHLVLRGFSDPDLILSGEETLWLWQSWREAVGRYGDPNIYGVASLDWAAPRGGFRATLRRDGSLELGLGSLAWGCPDKPRGA